MAERRASSQARSSRIWWSTWPAVVLWFVLGAIAVFPAVVGWTLTTFYAFDNAAGTDMTVDSGFAPLPLRILALVATVAALALPVLLAVWARRQWLGWFLVGVVASLAVLLVGLVMFGIF